MPRIGRWSCAALLFVAVAALAGQERFQQQYARDFPFRGGRVSVDHSFGAVIIDSDSGSEVHVRATIRASDPDFGRLILVDAEERGGGVAIRTQYPPHMMRGNHSSYSVDYRITVPAGAPLDVKNKFGSIEVSGVNAPGTFVNSYGSIRLRDLKGAQRVENAFGSIEVHDLDGVASITNKYGTIRAHDIGGELAVNNGFGSVEIENVHGNVDIATQNGSVAVRQVDGSLKVANSFASVVASDVKGHTDIRNQNGRIDVVGVGGNAMLRTSFGSVHAERVTGRADVENANGSVQLEDVGSDAIVRTSFASVFARNVHGAIDVKNQNGAIAVSEAGSGCRPISLVTSFSSIRVAVPANASYTVNARTSYGRISSSIPITTRTASDDALTGTIGSGNCRMELVNSNGSITIDKE
jgi:DUF4097 and DUF4098 domain-containing protein YvlB